MIEVRKDPSRKFCQECDNQVADNEQAIRVTVAGNIVILDHACAEGLHWALGRELGYPTINQLVDQITEINTANGWRENTGAIISGETPEAQIAAMSFVSSYIAGAIEAIRKPGTNDQGRSNIAVALESLRSSADYHDHMGVKDQADHYATYVTREIGQPVHGSKTQSICRARLFDTESEELTQAILADDVPNMAEELADIVIRVLDFVGGWNDAHPDKAIDLEASIMAKNERNRQRGYKHGGKRA